MTKFQEVYEELKSVLSGKTLDAMIPTFAFVFANSLFNLNVAIFSSIGLSFLLGLIRVLRKQTITYAVIGLFGVLFATALAFIAQNATNFFLPGIISSVLIVLAAILSLIFNKPLAAFASHITRGWPLAWFWRKDVKPAYREVTYLWLFYFAARLGLQVTLYLGSDINQLVWVNTLTGLPVLIVVLILSYVYGIWRLKKLKGPGVDEFLAKKEPPYIGQTRGF
ncbi:MAG: DUF3159 domain-containing protein [Acholeplasmataceae bacterium]